MSHSWALWATLAYLSGSVPFAWLLGKAKGIDIRTVGSGNVGATNLGRALGLRWGILCLTLDMLKGLVPVLAAGWVLGYLGRHLTPSQAWSWLAITTAPILGHVFPIWLRFKGGKGVATGLGSLLGLWPTLTLPTLIGVAAWLLVLAVSRYVSLASIVAAFTIPLALLVYLTASDRPPSETAPFLTTCSALSLLVVFRHRSNITRLLQGTEPKLTRLHCENPPSPTITF